MSEIGSFSKQDLAVHQAQIAIIKNNAEIQQKTMEVLLETPEEMTVSISMHKGNYADMYF